MIILASPRTGSFLACQLLEQYMVAKYPKYSIMPAYELYNRTGSTGSSVHYSPDRGMCIEEGKSGAYTVAEKLDLISRCHSIGVNFVAKVFYVNTKPIKWYRDNGYKLIGTLRRSVPDQINSYLLSQNSQYWHTYTSGRGALNFSDTKFKQQEPSNPKEYLDPESPRNLARANSIRKHNQAVLDLKPEFTVYLEDFQDDYDQFYLALGLTDFKEYVPNYDFVVTTKTKGS